MYIKGRYILAITVVFLVATNFTTASITDLKQNQNANLVLNPRVHDAMYSCGVLSDEGTVIYALTIEADKIYACGSTYFEGGWDAYICAIDISGQDPTLVWEDTYDRATDECLLSITHDSGKIYVVGYSEIGEYRQLLLKYDSATGSREGSNVFGSAVNPALGHAIEYYDGYLYTAGSQKNDLELYTVIINKYSLDLDLVWSNQLDAFVAGPEYAYDLDVSNGNAYITGVCHYLGQEWQLYPFLLKYDLGGQYIVWSNDYGVAWWSQVLQSCFYDGNRIYVTGADLGSQPSISLYLSWVYESNGFMDGSVDRLWGGYTKDDLGNDIIKYSSNLFVSGLTKSYGAGQADALLLKTDTSFNEIWYKVWGGSQDEEAFSSCGYEDAIFTVGYTDSYNEGVRSAFLLKYSSSTGNLFYSYVWNGGDIVQDGPPDQPSKPQGTKKGVTGLEYTYSTKCEDPEQDDVYYYWDWGDGSNSDWVGPFASGCEIGIPHKWNDHGVYLVKVKAKDIYGKESTWSDPLLIKMPRSKAVSLKFIEILALRASILKALMR